MTDCVATTIQASSLKPNITEASNTTTKVEGDQNNSDQDKTSLSTSDTPVNKSVSSTINIR